MKYTTQEDYFDIIKTRYRSFAGISDEQTLDGDALATCLASLSLDQQGPGKSIKSAKDELLGKASSISVSHELATILLAMRKLREAIVASSRADHFAKTVYLFIIRTAIMLEHVESYHPALLHLLCHVRKVVPLSEDEEMEFVGFYLLDVACRQLDFAAAFRIQNQHGFRDGKIGTVLTALVHGNWILFAKAKAEANAYQRRLIGWADGEMASCLVQYLGKSYLSIPKRYVEQSTDMDWQELKKLRNLPWVLDGETITIRQMKRK